jgi:hypothetical protein
VISTCNPRPNGDVMAVRVALADPYGIRMAYLGLMGHQEKVLSKII